MNRRQIVANVGAVVVMLPLAYLAFLMAIAAFPWWFAYFLNEAALYPNAPSAQTMFDVLWRTLLFWVLAYAIYQVERGRRRVAA